MKMKRIKTRIFFEDEAPRIGCGWRWVTVIVGHKWVRVVETSTGARAKFSIKQFEQIMPEVLA